MSDAVAAIGATITIDGVPIEEARDITGPEFTTDEVDVTNHDSPDFGEEVLPTLKRWGNVTFDMNYVPGSTGQQDLWDAWDARTVDTYILTLTNGTSFTFPAFVNRIAPSAAVTDINLLGVSLRVASAPTISQGS